MKVNVGIKLSNDAVVPKYNYSSDSGFDISANEDFTILPGETATIGTGLYFELPEGYELQIRSRSGLAAKNNIWVAHGLGTVDESYKGEVKLIMYNASKKNFSVSKGDRMAQGVIAPVVQAEFYGIEELTSSERSENGLGSSGLQ